MFCIIFPRDEAKRWCEYDSVAGRGQGGWLTDVWNFVFAKRAVNKVFNMTVEKRDGK